MPVAYWVSENFVRVFESEKVFDYSIVQEGLKTGDNDRFIRFWYEVDNHLTNIFSNNTAKWVYHTKGGDFRKWYGNKLEVLNFQNNGEELRNYKGASLSGSNNYFKTSINYNRISSSKTSFRFSGEDSIPNMAGLAIYCKEPDYIYYILGWLNTDITTIILSIINPTLNFPPGTIGKLPIRVEKGIKQKVDEVVKENIELSKQDWDSFETSWDFEGHPLI